MAWMDEVDGISFVQLSPDGLEVGVPQIFAVVGSEERYAVSFEHVEGVFDLDEGVFGVSEVGHGGEETETCWVSGA